MVSNPRKFVKRKFQANKNRNWQGSYSSEKVKEEPKMCSKSKESKKESKIGGDSGFDCHYYGGKNHFAKDCMLKKKAEKVDEEANLLRRLDEIKKRKSAANNNTMNASIVIHDGQFDEEWYIDSGCSRHMTGRREELREFRSLKDGGTVNYDNNSFGTIKGYGMITNGDFSIKRVTYVEGVQHNLISVSQIVVGTGLKVSFDDEGSEIVEKKSNNILLKSKRKGKCTL
ncbi:hypothetical protein Lser_V15G14186 [Lactuca serriola]